MMDEGRLVGRLSVRSGVVSGLREGTSWSGGSLLNSAACFSPPVTEVGHPLLKES